MLPVQIFLQNSWRPKKHLLIHSRENPFKYSQCNYCCKEAGNLKQHKLTHSGKKAFKCAQCNYSCSRVANLKNHILTHSGNKAFSCTQYSYSASRAGYLRTHMRSHSGEKPVAPSASFCVQIDPTSRPTCILILERDCLSVISATFPEIALNL